MSRKNPISGFQGKHTVEDFALSKPGSHDQHRVCLALRRAGPDSPFEWTAVRGLRLKADDPRHAHLKLFTYRDGRVVYVVEEETGIHLAAAATLPRVRDTLREWLADVSQQQLADDLKTMFKQYSPGPKPTVKLKGTI